MNLSGTVPMVLYDDRCSLCSGLARAIYALSRKRIRVVGHYSRLGKWVRNEALSSDATRMFWFIDGETAYGGRAGVMPLVKAILTAKGEPRFNFILEEPECRSCNRAKSIFIGTRNLLANSRKIKLR